MNRIKNDAYSLGLGKQVSGGATKYEGSEMPFKHQSVDVEWAMVGKLQA